MKRNILTGSFAALGLLLLILDAKTGLKGANEGITLCLYTVVPALFPFFVLSALLTSSLTGGKNRLFGLLGKLCRIPEGSEILLATGLLGGYPVGAKSVAQAWEKGWLSQEDARRMLGFCSNAGPAFLFGMLSQVFRNTKALWVLWGIHILSAVITARLLPGDKVQHVERLLSEQPYHAKLAFVGDGINDAPVLSRADIGIAMGAMGSDAAIEAADLVLMHDDPRHIAKALRISRKCLSIVYQNIVFAITVKVLSLVLVAMGIGGMGLAIFADVGVMVLAVLNAMRMLVHR